MKSRTTPKNPRINAVAPFAGARIEIANAIPKATNEVVAPFAGARIEIPDTRIEIIIFSGRSLRGSAD